MPGSHVDGAINAISMVEGADGKILHCVRSRVVALPSGRTVAKRYSQAYCRGLSMVRIWYRLLERRGKL